MGPDLTDIQTSMAWSFWQRDSGGVEEDRTPDLRIANATLSQLSYHPGEGAHFTPKAGTG